MHDNSYGCNDGDDNNNNDEDDHHQVIIIIIGPANNFSKFQLTT